MLITFRKEARFVGHLIRLNLASNMEYRASFLSQIVGMLLNNGIYFIFWLLFFDRFEQIRGYRINEIYMLFAVEMLAFGLAFTVAGNARAVAGLIAQGRLDYYLALPRSVLPHLIFSRMGQASIGDLTFGIVAFLFAGKFDLISILLFVIVTMLAATIFVAFAVTTGSLAFLFGNAAQVSRQLVLMLGTLGVYPFELFQGVTRLVLLTVLPAAFIGAVPVRVVQLHDAGALALLAGVAAVSVVMMVGVFRLGLRRYESGSAININI